MRTAAHILLVLGLIALTACSSTKKAVKANTAAEVHTTAAYTDTTKTVADSIGHKRTDTDTTKTVATSESGGVIEFVEGGGAVSIDGNGTVTLHGVKSIKGKHRDTAAQSKAVSSQTEDTATHRQQEKGVSDEQTDDTKIKAHTEEKDAPRRYWYETTLMYVGLAVCIAAILWAIFLYLKRKH